MDKLLTLQQVGGYVKPPPVQGIDLPASRAHYLGNHMRRVARMVTQRHARLSDEVAMREAKRLESGSAQ